MMWLEAVSLPNCPRPLPIKEILVNGFISVILLHYNYKDSTSSVMSYHVIVWSTDLWIL